MTLKIIRLPETESTNSYAIEFLAKNRPEEECVIIADHQTQGKGTETNTWESEKGKNLTFSLVLYPAVTAEHQFMLNKALSLGIYDFLVSLLPDQKVSIKWPNDLYIGDKKVCGILIQNSVMGNNLAYMVAGIGLNVNQTGFTSLAPNPVSLKMATGKDFDLGELLENLIHAIMNRYSTLSTETALDIENGYRAALYRLMEWHEYLVDNYVIKARITGTNAFGQLVLESEKGKVISCDFKEVKFLI